MNTPSCTAPCQPFFKANLFSSLQAPAAPHELQRHAVRRETLVLSLQTAVGHMQVCGGGAALQYAGQGRAEEACRMRGRHTLAARCPAEPWPGCICGRWLHPAQASPVLHLTAFLGIDHSTLKRGRIILTLPIMLLQSQNLETLCRGANILKEGGRRMSFLRVREEFIAGRVGPQMSLWLPRMRCRFRLQPAWPLSSVCRIRGESRGWPSAKASPS